MNVPKSTINQKRITLNTNKKIMVAWKPWHQYSNKIQLYDKQNVRCALPTFTSSLVLSIKLFLPVSSLLSILNFDGFFSRISMVSSKSSRSHSILRSEFFSSVFVHSISSLLNLIGSSCNSSQRRYRPLVLFRALKTSLQRHWSTFCPYLPTPYHNNK